MTPTPVGVPRKSKSETERGIGWPRTAARGGGGSQWLIGAVSVSQDEEFLTQQFTVGGYFMALENRWPW